MLHTEHEISTVDGLNLYAQSWMPEGDLKGVLTFSHGLGEHSGRYTHVGKRLVRAGYGLHMADLRGHGASPGKRGHIMDWREFQHDLQAMMVSARQLAPESAHFFGGHSQGGLLALSMAVDNLAGYAGVVISAPFLRVGFEPPAWKITLSQLLTRILPGLTFSTELETAALSRDADVVAAYEADPEVHDQISARAYTETVQAQQEIIARAGDLALPLLMLQGTADRLVNPQTNIAFFEKAGTEDKTLKRYEGFYHEVFNELEHERVLADVIGWLDAHI